MFSKANLTVIGLIALGGILLNTPLVSADTTYGGGYGGYGYNNTPATKTISIDKKVQNPTSNVFVDQLTIHDPRFTPDQTIVFQLNVTNTGNARITNMTVKDIIPQYLTLTDSTLTYDTNTKTYSFPIDSLNPGETKTFTLHGKIASAAQLPVNSGIFCLVNQSVAFADAQTAQDNAQFCVEKPGLTKGGLPIYQSPKVAATPATGAETLPLALLPALSGLGIFLRRKNGVK